MPIVVDGRTRLVVTLLRRPEPTEPAGGGTVSAFLTWWGREAHLRELPAPRFTGADRTIAGRLLERHGMKRLKELGTHYWRRHAFMREKGLYEMVAFAGRITVIEQEIASQA